MMNYELSLKANTGNAQYSKSHTGCLIADQQPGHPTGTAGAPCMLHVPVRLSRAGTPA